MMHRSSLLTVFMLALLCTLSGCTSFNPTPLSELDYLARTTSQSRDGLEVNVSVMTRGEARAAFGKTLDKKQIQPVWLEIINNSDQPMWLMLNGIDPNYYSAREAATVIHRGVTANQNEIDRYFDDLGVNPYVPAGGATSGFVFSNLKQGTKEVRVRLLGAEKQVEFDFFVTVPGLKADWQHSEFKTIYSDDEIIRFEDPAEFRAALEEFICCTTRADGSGSGDPINLVIITQSEDSLLAFIQAGWDETEIITAGSAWRTFKSFLAGSEYKYSPISPLYLFQRPQDLSLQKARNTINERNHLRLWSTPWLFQGNRVWVGGISRDIGVFWTTRTWNLTSHAIDSDIDETRNYILEDLAAAQRLSGYGFVKGVGTSSSSDPKENLLGTPWWTDGSRAVLMLSDTPVTMQEIEYLDWTARMPAAK